MLPRTEEEPGEDQFLTAFALAPGELNTGTPRCRAAIPECCWCRRLRAPDGEHACRYVHGVHVGRTQEDRVRPADLVGDLVAILRQPLAALLRNAVRASGIRKRISRTAVRSRA